MIDENDLIGFIESNWVLYASNYCDFKGSARIPIRFYYNGANSFKVTVDGENIFVTMDRARAIATYNRYVME